MAFRLETEKCRLKAERRKVKLIFLPASKKIQVKNLNIIFQKNRNFKIFLLTFRFNFFKTSKKVPMIR